MILAKMHIKYMYRMILHIYHKDIFGAHKIWGEVLKKENREKKDGGKKHKGN